MPTTAQPTPGQLEEQAADLVGAANFLGRLPDVDHYVTQLRGQVADACLEVAANLLSGSKVARP